MFAKPFVGQLGRGHQDGVYQMCHSPSSLSKFASASGDGVVKTWELESREEVWQTKAHDNIVKGLAWVDNHILTCGMDGAKLFTDQSNSTAAPTATWLGAFTSLSKHRSQNSFAASTSDSVKVYDIERSAAPEVLRWSAASADTITHVCFNPVETSILASAATDRSICLYDLRTSSALSKVDAQGCGLLPSSRPWY